MVKSMMGLKLLMSLLLTETAMALAFVPRTYIVQMNTGSSSSKHRLARRQSSLEAVNANPNAIIYSYNTVLDGYAATLTEAQAAALRDQPDVLSVQRDSIKQLHTTHTPAFLGLEEAALLQQRGFAANLDPMDYVEARQVGIEAEADLVIGVLDTGGWPESEAYNDAGFGAPPATWKGSCEVNEAEGWTEGLCNNKLVGAKAFFKGLDAAFAASNQTFDWSKEYRSPRDADGHGTHTSSTAGGSPVAGVSLYGNAAGTAKGVAPGARLAIYKTCYTEIGCFSSDILAGMDAAVADGVNVMSMSLGGNPGLGGTDDFISTGAYSAVARGVFVSASGGNSGPGVGTVTNNAPWILTVGASTLDRVFPASVTLGNGETFAGQSLYTNNSVPDDNLIATQRQTSFILGSAAVAAGAAAENATLCVEDTLDPAIVAGKVVICVRGGNGRVEKGQVVKDVGAVGMVLINDEESGNSLVADAHVLPAVMLGSSALAPIQEYVASARNVSLVLDFKGTVLGVSAPEIASFSSRGPSFPAPDVLKPDITGPGVNILAAWNGGSPTGNEGDNRTVAWNVISGTSMSCPHLAGVAAYIKARRPEWTVAQIKSAIMTTAYTTTKGETTTMVDQANGTAATVFEYGNGHVDPVAALDPGLLYDIQPTEYLDFLCAFNYTTEQIRTISRDNFSCNAETEYDLHDLNLPSFAVWYNTNITTGEKTVTFHRNVTNVGGASTYTVNVEVEDPSVAQVKVEPETLIFAADGEGAVYSVTVTLAAPEVALGPGESKLSEGRLTWTDGTHTVASSIGLFWGAPLEVGFGETAAVNGSTLTPF